MRGPVAGGPSGASSSAAVRAVVVEGFFTRLGFGVVTFALPLYALELGLGLAEVGLLAATKAAVVPAVKPLMGVVVDRFGARRGYLAAVMLRFLGALLLFAATTPATLFAVRALQGAASAARDPASITVLAKHKKASLGRTFSVAIGAKDLGNVSAGLLGGGLLAATGGDFRLLWVCTAVLAAVPVLAVWRWVPAGTRDAAMLEGPTASETAALQSADEDARGASRTAPVPARPEGILREPGLRLVAALGLCAGTTAHMTHGLFQVYAAEVAGLTAVQIGLIYSSSVGTLLLLGPLAGWAGDRFGTGPLTGVRGVANALSSLVFAAAPVFGGVLAGRFIDDAGKAAFRPTWGALVATASRRAGPRGGRVAASLDTALSLGEAVGPLLAGLLWDWYGVGVFFSVRAALGVGTELFLGRRLRVQLADGQDERPGGTAAEGLSRGRLLLSSARARILAWYVCLIALALVASTLAVRQVLLARLDERVNAALNQEVSELATLAREGIDPETGERFDSVARIFEVFLGRNIPAENETMLTFLRGEPHLYSSQPAPVALHRDEQLMRQWAATTTPRLGTTITEVGRVDYLATPVQAAGETTPRGVFVVAEFRDLERREVDDVVQISAAVGFATLLVASILAWGVAGRILTPVRLVTATALRISESDLSRRIPVDGSDEISRLAATFNAMLDRLEIAFTTQREFIDDAGHELRTPITIIRGHLELLGDDPAEREETVAIVTDELDRMNRMVNDLLVLAKAERPDFLSQGPVEVGALTDDLLAKASALGPRRWTLDERAEGVVVADGQRLTQAVMQLAANATQHTEAGDVVAIGSRLTDAELRLWVRDTGAGIAPGDQDRVFDRFARASDGRRRSEGAGLGLAIVRAIATASGGRVELRSERGQGATFTLVIPQSPAEPSPLQVDVDAREPQPAQG